MQDGWPATGPGRPLVEWPGTSRPAGPGWMVAGGGERRGDAGPAGGLHGAAPRPGGAWPALAHVARHQRGTAVVEGHRTAVFRRPDGRRLTGQERLPHVDWPGRDSRQRPGRREARLTGTRPTCGAGPRVIVAAPGQPGDDRLCQATSRTAPRLIRAWQRRSWMAHHFRTRTQRLATAAGQVQGADADNGPVVVRLVAGVVVLSIARRLFNGRVTREAIVCSLTQHWRVRTSKDLA